MPTSRSDQALIHFYRASVAHADVWRQRMDMTTNWAVASTAAMISFTFGSTESPHVVLLLALAFDGMFLLMESRRYQMYDLLRRRFRGLHHYVIVPALLPEGAADRKRIDSELQRLAHELGRTVPYLQLGEAVGYRVRRNYGYLLSLATAAWLLKLEMHPVPTGSLTEFVARAGVGVVPGALILAAVTGVGFWLVLLAMRAPSEQIVGWTELPSPWARLKERPPWTQQRGLRSIRTRRRRSDRTSSERPR
jgi:uncharacterized membrane protein